MESKSVRQNLSLIKIQNLPNRELLIKPRLETCNILCLIFVIMLNIEPTSFLETGKLHGQVTSFLPDPGKDPQTPKKSREIQGMV